MNRLGIFCFYDSDGIVDDYIPYLLNDMARCLSRLIIVCNGGLSEQGKTILSQYTNDIIIRDNSGFDGGAYKYVLTSFLDEHTLTSFDEVVLFNDTFFGPFYTFEQVFSEMEHHACDFWGLAMHGVFLRGDGVGRQHAQSYFLVIKKNVVESSAFKTFWRELAETKSVSETIDSFEIGLSSTLIDAGFTLDAYLHLDEFITEDPQRNLDYSQLLSGTMIEKYEFPILKRKTLTNQSGYPDNYEVDRALRYIYTNYDYPIDYIYKSIFRKTKLGDLFRSIGLNFEYTKNDVDTYDNRRLLILVYDKDGEIKEDINEKLNTSLSECELVYVSANPIAYILSKTSIEDSYDYFCLIQDDIRVSSMGRYARRVWRRYHFCATLLKNRIAQYLAETDKRQKTLGLFYSAPTPEDMLGVLNRRDQAYNIISSYKRRFNLPLNYDSPEDTIYTSRSFWCSADILGSVIKYYSVDDVEAWYLSLPYIAQMMGKGSSYISSEEQQTVYMNMVMKTVPQFLCINKEEQYREQLSFIADLFKSEDKRLYLYGCGRIANYYTNILESVGIGVHAYIISDGEKCAGTYRGKPVIYLSDYNQTCNDIVLVSVGEKLKVEICDELDRRNIRHYTR